MRLSNMRAGFTLAEGATHVAHCENSRKQGFTLAEVLITLGIIGVVAAMTMPTLMNSTQGAQYKAAYKKALSALSQAVTLNVALDEWNFADLDASTYKLEDMLKSRMNVVRTETGSFAGPKTGNYKATGTDGDFEPKTGNTTLFFNDGIMFSYVTADAKKCTNDATVGTVKRCTGFIDVNGIKAPNKIVKCDTGSDDTNCVIKNPTDVYPVVFYDQTILPNSPAARAVLYSK